MESREVPSVLDSPDNSFTISVAGEPDVEGIIDLLSSVAVNAGRKVTHRHPESPVEF